jgi:hypothetical protein
METVFMSRLQRSRHIRDSSVAQPVSHFLYSRFGSVSHHDFDSAVAQYPLRGQGSRGVSQSATGFSVSADQLVNFCLFGLSLIEFQSKNGLLALGFLRHSYIHLNRLR